MKAEKYPTRIMRGLFLLAVIVTTYFATADSDHMVIKITVYDKFQHAAAFFTLTMLADFAWPQTPVTLRKILALLAYGMALELVQSQLPYRDFSLLDFLADGCGILLYFVSIPVLQRLPVMRRRWQF